MYEQFFNLTAEPFRLSPDHRFCYSHAQYHKAKAYMDFAYTRAEGFVMVTGAPGTGKTTLIGDLMDSLAHENVAVANLVSTQLVADDLLRMVAFGFGIPAEAAEKSDVLQQLTTRFLTLHGEGGRALLIVDEAQDLTSEAMEELRLLTNLQRDNQPLLQIFLLGQPELRDLVLDQAMEQVHQRIIATSHLEALNVNETREYVEHRLKVVGWRNDPQISSAVFPIIHLFSEGVPRRINLICSRLFLECFVDQRHQIGTADARSVVQELTDELLITHNLLNDDLFFAPDVFDGPLLPEPAQEDPPLKEPLAKSQPELASAPQSDISVGEPLVEEMPPGDSGVDVPGASWQEVEVPMGITGGERTELAETELAGMPLARGGRRSVRPATWFIVFAVLLAAAGGAVAFLVMDEHLYETTITEIQRIYAALATEFERIYATLVKEFKHNWCRLSFAC